jgi:effector-binding domain-containing protein
MRTFEIARADLQPQRVAVVRAHVPRDGVADLLGGAFGEVMQAVAHQGRRVVGMPFGRYRVTPDGFDVEAGFPVDAQVEPEGRVEPGELPGGPVAHVVYQGPYDGVGAAYEAAVGWVVDNGDQVVADPWECYLDEPGVPEPRTEIFVPFRGTTIPEQSRPVT